MNAIEIKQLTKSYGDFVLGPLDLTLPTGCIMGLVGENGAGKSTTIRLILDAIRPDSGNITLLGENNQSRPALREDIGVVMDEVGIAGHLTPIQLGKIMRHTFARWDEEQYAGYLKRFSLPPKKKFKDFSRGMKMKLGLAVALSHAPKLLVLDEATSGLDPVVRDEILDIFLDFAKAEDHSILISSHIVSDLEKICDYIAFLHKGRLMLCEEADTLRERYGILHTDAPGLAALDPTAILGTKKTAFSIEVIVRRDSVPAILPLSPVDIEQLFIFMTKEVAGK